MGILEQEITERYALYLGDCMEVLPSLPEGSIHMSLYSPPFAGLYQYTSSERDLSNCKDYEEFLEHYGYIVDELARVTMPGRITAVHCADVPSGNSGGDELRDLPGDIIRLHTPRGFSYLARYHVWKEPLAVRNRTMRKDLAHKTLVDDSSRCSVANADYLLIFRKHGPNPIPIGHPHGLMDYVGSRPVPQELLRYRGLTGNQIENRYSQWIWRQYASAFWDDIRLSRVLPFKQSREHDDERHIHPLQLDVIERAVILWSNEGETVLTPFLGVGSEAYGAVSLGRRAIGIELKASYYRQAVKNLASAEVHDSQPSMDMALC
jgi:DNA modification methylase